VLSFNSHSQGLQKEVQNRGQFFTDALLSEPKILQGRAFRKPVPVTEHSVFSLVKKHLLDD
jgi:hypothetical protein